MKGFFERRSERRLIQERMKHGIIRNLSEDPGNSFLQFAATVSVGFSQLGNGSSLSWSSPSLKYLMSGNSEFSITLKQGAWMTSLSSIGFIIGFLLIPLLMDKVGRKYTLLIYAVPQIISWTLIVVAKNYIILYIARIVGGIGYSCMGLISIYIAEIAESRIRGMLSISMIIACDIGALMVATMGAYLSYQTMNLVLLAIPIIYFLSFMFMPESPYFYSMQRRDEDAVKSMMRLRGVKNIESVASEIEKIKMSENKDEESKKINWKELFCNQSNRKGFMIVICAHVTSMSSGTLVVIAYAQQIFEFSGFSLSSEYSYMILMAVKILSALLASQLIERLGRKFLYLTSGILSALALGFVSLSFFLKLHLHIDMVFVNWCPLAGLIMFELASSLGISSLPFILGGELLPVSVKKIAITITCITAAVTTFVAELIFPILNEAIGVFVSFFIFATCCLTGTLFVFSVMPETKGKSLEEIQNIFNSKQNEDELRLLARKINKYGVCS